MQYVWHFIYTSNAQCVMAQLLKKRVVFLRAAICNTVRSWCQDCTVNQFSV